MNKYPGIARKATALLIAGVGAVSLASCGGKAAQKVETWDARVVCQPRSEPMATIGDQATSGGEVKGWAEIDVACVDGASVSHPLAIYGNGEVRQRPAFNIGDVVIAAQIDKGSDPTPLRFSSVDYTTPAGDRVSVSQVELGSINALEHVAVK